MSSPPSGGTPCLAASADLRSRDAGLREPLREAPGLVRLAFAASGDGGPTRLVERYASHPFAVQRPLYGDPALPGQPQVYLLALGAGVLAGDALRVEIDVGTGASARICAVGATRLHPTPGGRSRQDIRLRLRAGAFLEWLPDPLIPFAGSRFTQSVEVRLDPGAQWIGSDVLVAGREACGERFAFDRLEQQLAVFEHEGAAPAVAEAFILDPARRAPDGPAVMRGFPVLGTLRAATRQVPARLLVEALRAAAAGVSGVLAGATALPTGAGAMVRVLGPAIHPVALALHAAWDAARRLCVGVPAPEPRRY